MFVPISLPSFRHKIIKLSPKNVIQSPTIKRTTRTKKEVGKSLISIFVVKAYIDKDKIIKTNKTQRIAIVLNENKITNLHIIMEMHKIKIKKIK